jgi:hypothetical protein
MAGKGRPKGSKNKTTMKAGEYAREILEQEEHVAALKEQAKNGVGNASDQLPPATHKVLMSYGYGNPKDKIEIDVDVDALGALSTIELAARARAVAKRIAEEQE